MNESMDGLWLSSTNAPLQELRCVFQDIGIDEEYIRDSIERISKQLIPYSMVVI